MGGGEGREKGKEGMKEAGCLSRILTGVPQEMAQSGQNPTLTSRAAASGALFLRCGCPAEVWGSQNVAPWGRPRGLPGPRV